MDFQSPAQQQIYEKVRQHMVELFGELGRQRTDAPGFVITMGSALAHILVLPWGEDNAVVTVRSYVVTGAELVPDLLKYLLQENDRMRFGSFGVDQKGSIFFQYALVGSTCDKLELKAAVMAVVGTSDQYDDQIVQRWGGLRAADQIGK